MGGRARAVALVAAQLFVGAAAFQPGVPSASAATVVSGDRDSNAPLVIDPSTTPTDPYTRESSPTQVVLFIQRMPVTKAIDSVTLGDLGLGTGCVSGTVGAQIWEHQGGAWGGTTSPRFYATASVPLPATPGRVTWTFPTTTLLEGHAYSFRIVVSGCSTVKQTTWSHNSSQVDGGPSWCEQAPSNRRMWHVSGLDDATWSCVTRTEPARTFKPDMPGGWLVSHQPSTTADIMAGSYPSDGQPSPYACTTSSSHNPATLGGGWVYWRPNPDLPDDYKDFVCRWSQFGPPGEQLADGWYYALPWLVERSGAPRDMYLELETIDYDALLAAHVPVLKYDSGENFHVLSPGAMSDFYVDNGDPSDSNRLSDGSGTFAFSNFLLGGDEADDPAALTLDYLRPAYPAEAPGLPAKRRSGSASETSDVLGARGDADDGFYAGDAAIMESDPAYSYKVYGRVAHGSDDSVWPGGKLWLQYWFFFYFNDVEVIGEHEGDWEMIQVGLDASNAPDVVGYAQHNSGQRCGWASVEKSSLRPMVYTAEGTHASYFGPDRIPLQYLFDHADGLGGALLSPNLHQIATNSPAWVGWRGAWGDSGSSPQGPQFQGAKWSDPSDWADGLDEC